MQADGRSSVLILRGAERAAALEALTADLLATRAWSVETAESPDRLLHLQGVAAVYADVCAPLQANHAAAVRRFIEQGGTVVAAGATLAAWAAEPEVASLAGWTPDGRTVETELRVSGSGVSGAALRIRDEVHLLAHAPADSTPALVAQWHFSEQVVAYSRAVGDGSFVYLGLGRNVASYADPAFRNLVLRWLRPGNATVTGVGLLGFGSLGSAHAGAIAQVPGLAVRAVCDTSAERRAAASALGFAAVADESRLFATDGVDLVLVGTPPASHAPAVQRSLQAGKHVVCEKPFALHVGDCDAMIALAEERGLLLTVYQNRRWDPDFVALRNAVRSGTIGDLFYMESFVGGYSHPCNYWHSHEEISGGTAYDWGSHYIDWILQLIDGPVASVRSQSHKRVWHDVTNADQVSIDLRFASGAEAHFLHSDLAAALKPKWYALGTAGAVVGEWQEASLRTRGPEGEIDEERVLPTDLPARIRVLRPDGDGGTHSEALSLPRRDRLGFWRNVAAHLQHAEPLAVTAGEARRTVAVIEAAGASAAQGGTLVNPGV